MEGQDNTTKNVTTDSNRRYDISIRKDPENNSLGIHFDEDLTIIQARPSAAMYGIQIGMRIVAYEGVTVKNQEDIMRLHRVSEKGGLCELTVVVPDSDESGTTSTKTTSSTNNKNNNGDDDDGDTPDDPPGLTSYTSAVKEQEREILLSPPAGKVKRASAEEMEMIRKMTSSTSSTSDAQPLRSPTALEMHLLNRPSTATALHMLESYDDANVDATTKKDEEEDAYTLDSPALPPGVHFDDRNDDEQEILPPGVPVTDEVGVFVGDVATDSKRVAAAVGVFPSTTTKTEMEDDDDGVVDPPAEFVSPDLSTGFDATRKTLEREHADPPGVLANDTADIADGGTASSASHQTRTSDRRLDNAVVPENLVAESKDAPIDFATSDVVRENRVKDVPIDSATSDSANNLDVECAQLKLELEHVRERNAKLRLETARQYETLAHIHVDNELESAHVRRDAPERSTDTQEASSVTADEAKALSASYVRSITERVRREQRRKETLQMYARAIASRDAVSASLRELEEIRAVSVPQALDRARHLEARSETLRTYVQNFRIELRKTRRRRDLATRVLVESVKKSKLEFDLESSTLSERLTQALRDRKYFSRSDASLSSSGEFFAASADLILTDTVRKDLGLLINDHLDYLKVRLQWMITSESHFRLQNSNCVGTFVRCIMEKIPRLRPTMPEYRRRRRVDAATGLPPNTAERRNRLRCEAATRRRQVESPAKSWSTSLRSNLSWEKCEACTSRRRKCNVHAGFDT
eukprot:g2645.t1